MQKHVINIGLIVILAACIFTLPTSWPLFDTPFAADKAESQQEKTKTNHMVLVLDASGSIWGQIDGKAKIIIAKEVMAELIDQIPADFQTGLTVYGHRRKGDCEDVERVIPFKDSTV